MSEKITFRAEIEFNGSADELAKVVEGIRSMPVKVSVGKFPLPFPYPGGWPFPIFRALSTDMISKYTKGRPAFPENILGGINGGIRDPHLHFKDQVSLLDQESFAKVVGNVAEHIVQEIAVEGGYQDTIGVLRELNSIEEHR